ncbi:MAG: hypothetical protein PSV22_19355 [Pseudolabrys sp.]|nr:hypothetical protein [Pseudolabrys sp.]
MKKFLVAVTAVALLSGPALAQNTGVKEQMNKESSMGVKPDAATPAKKKHRATTTGQATDKQGYTVRPPVNDPGRYSNLPGKDGATSKAHIQDH